MAPRTALVVELAGLLLCVAVPVRAAVAPLLLLLLAAAALVGLLHARIPGPLAVPGGEHDLELVQLVPLLVGALALGNREERLEPGARGRRLGIGHGLNITLPARRARGDGRPTPLRDVL